MNGNFLRRSLRFLGYGLFAVFVAYIDCKALLFARAVQSLHPNVAHETRLLAICCALVFAASIALDSIRHGLTRDPARFSEPRFNVALGLVTTAAFVAIGSAMIQFGVRFVK